MIILNRIQCQLHSSDNQFGFKKYHSTELCIYALKEVINYYRSLNTPVFITFVDIKSAFDRVSYYRLFQKLVRRGVNKTILLTMKSFYESQRLFAGWGNVRSAFFRMGNGIRQGSVLSPYLFNVYVDGLNRNLSSAGVGCHIAGTPLNNFSYADDLAIVAPSATAMNELLGICDKFAADNHIVYNTTKSVSMVILPPRMKFETVPNLYLNNCILNFVDKFKYLGYILNKEFTDDDDIRRERQRLCIRGNMLIRAYNFCSLEVKYFLFKTYMYSFYCSSLWSTFNVESLRQLKVVYNMVMRKLAGYPRWHSATDMFSRLNMRSFPEQIRNSSYSFMVRLDAVPNFNMYILGCSDARTRSLIHSRWNSILYV